MNFQWIPLVAVIFGIIFMVVKGPNAVATTAYSAQTKIMTEQVVTLTEIKSVLIENQDLLVEDKRITDEHIKFEEAVLEDLKSQNKGL